MSFCVRFHQSDVFARLKDECSHLYLLVMFPLVIYFHRRRYVTQLRKNRRHFPRCAWITFQIVTVLFFPLVVGLGLDRVALIVLSIVGKRFMSVFLYPPKSALIKTYSPSLMKNSFGKLMYPLPSMSSSTSFASFQCRN